MTVAVLSEWEVTQARNARNRALIMQILSYFPKGLTTQQIVAKEIETYGYSFLTDNRCRELRAKGFVRKDDSVKPCRWVPLLPEE